MEKWQEKFLYTRRENASHKSLIENAYLATSRPDNHFRRLCRRVFTLHSVDIPNYNVPEWPGAKEFENYELPNGIIDWLTYHFHHDHYTLPEKIIKGVSPKGALASFEDEFLSRIKNTCVPGQKNKVTFLIGKVGSGKSTLVSNIISARGKGLIDNDNIVPIRIDLDKKLNHKLPPRKNEKSFFFHIIYEKLLEAYKDLRLIDRSFYLNIAKRTSFTYQDPPIVCRDNLKALCENLSIETKKSTCLIVDNIDFLYHFYDRALFVEEAANGKLNEEQEILAAERNRCYELIQCIITSFFDDNDALAKIGANILITLREESLEQFVSNRSDLAPTDPRLFTYRLVSPDIQQVIGAHLALMKSAFDLWPKETLRKIYTEAIGTIQPMVESLPVRRKKMLHKDLMDLSRQWLRQIVEHYGRFVWLPVSIENKEDREILTNRFNDQYTPGIISFIQNGNRLYTQFRSEFPNIYLVRGDKRQERNIAWANLCKHHMHTYWLKRLIIELIAGRLIEGKEVTPQLIYDVFVDKEKSGNAFEDHIVRLVLGSLSQVEKCNVLEINFSQSRSFYDIEGISLSNRGWRLLGYVNEGKEKAENVFMDTFTYLQTIVDDFILPLPRSVYDFFKYEEGLDYGYLAAPAEMYGQLTSSMIKKKIRQVFCFIDVLKESYKYEKIKFKKAFNNLEEHIRCTSPNEIENRVRNSIIPIQNYIKRQHNKDFDYTNYICDRTFYIERLKNDLEEIYIIKGKDIQ